MPGQADVDTSPAHSDDGQSFQDAADGSSPQASPSNELEDTREQDEGGTASSVEPASPASVAGGKGAKAKGTGVAALMAKFQVGGTDAAAGSPGTSSRNGSRSASPSQARQTVRPSGSKAEGQAGGEASRETSGQSASDVGSETGGEPGNGKALIVEEEGKDAYPTAGLALAEATERVELDDTEAKVAPSKGALSLLDPSETIANPFGADLATPTLTPGADEPAGQTATPYADESELKRFSATSSKHETGTQPTDTPTTSQVNRFSTVSLSTTAPYESKRDTISAATNPTLPGPIESEPYTSAGFLARQNARLSRAEGDRHGSIDIKERMNELRYGHVRDNSSSSSSQGKAGDKVGEASRGPSLSQPTSPSPADEPYYDDGPRVMENEAIDWDFWGNVMSNYQEIARTQPSQLSRAIQAGIPGALRGMMWQLMSSSKDEEMEIIYAFYLKQMSPHEKMIRKDLSRTFPGQGYFQDGKGIGQENLFNVVKAYSLYDEECGYCQGMQFVVGPLLLNMPDEEAFSTLVRLMKSYDLRGHFVPNMPALQLRLYQFDRLLEEMLPLLHRHLVRAGVKSSMYASGWFMTLFSYRSPLNICFRILDSVFAEGIEALFRFALALMRKNEEELLTLSFEEAVPLLAARVFDVYKTVDGGDEEGSGVGGTRTSGGEGGGGANVGTGYRVNEYVREAFEMQITPFMLDSFASDFAEQVRVSTAHRREIESLKIQNKNLQGKVKNLEDQLGAVQQEHVDLVKSIVMAKLAKEEMAEELVRYKLMYAEATLLADQSGVNQASPSHLSTSTSSTRDRQSS